MNKDIKALLAIYTILILIGWNIGLKKEIKKNCYRYFTDVIKIIEG